MLLDNYRLGLSAAAEFRASKAGAPP